MQVTSAVKEVLSDVTGLPEEQLTEDQGLLDTLPNMNSMMLVQIIGGLQDRLKIEISIEQLNPEDFETVGSLTRLVERLS